MTLRVVGNYDRQETSLRVESVMDTGEGVLNVELAKGIGSQVEVISIRGLRRRAFLSGLRSCVKLPEIV